MAELTYSLGTFGIGEVAVSRAYALLKLRRIGTATEHIGVIVRLDDHGVSLTGPKGGFFGERTYIGHYHEFMPSYKDGVSDCLGGVVGHCEVSCPDCVPVNLVPSRGEYLPAGGQVFSSQMPYEEGGVK